MRIRRAAALMLGCVAGLALGQTGASPVDYSVFKEPPKEYRGVRWVGFNLSNVTEASITATVRETAKSDSWGSFLLGPGGGPTTGLSKAYMEGSRRKPSDQGIVYLSEDFFRVYRAALQEARKLGFPMSLLYDEWTYPTGIAGGQFYSTYPEHAAKFLEMTEKDVTGPARALLPVPKGIYVGAVMMNRDSYERIDVSSRKNDKNVVSCQVPKGNWKVMVFYLDTSFRPASSKGGFPDYLDSEAMDKFIAMSYEKYYTNLKEYFGSMIKMSYYDEPALHYGRTWTPGFNAGFRKTYGFSPMPYYPALWYDIGPETAAARNALFGYRAELYAENFVGKLARWCEAHGIQFSGHMDQEEARNPVGVNGDMMKVFEHQQVPGIDDIYYTGRSNVAYKIVSSAAYNYDRPLVFAETYAAYRKMSPTIALQTAMDQFVMGVTLQVGSRPKEIGPEMDRFVGRMSYLLRHGRHVADIAVLYPIAALQSAYHFATPPTSNRPGSPPEFYYGLEGGIVPSWVDYMDLGEMLFRGLRLDYTYLHPEVLESRTLVDTGRLILDNQENREEFRVLIVPGGDTISAAAARKIRDFYRSGGMVIATSKLPYASAEFNKDTEVREMTAEVFGIPFNEPMTAEIRIVADDFKSYFSKRNEAGGRSFFLPQPDTNLMNAVLREVVPVRDVDIQQAPMWPVKMGTAYDGALTYTHKVRQGRDIYFFVNSQERPVETKVILRGTKSLEIWNPHTGERTTPEVTHGEAGGQPVTTLRLELPPVSSLFYVTPT